ncbi:hypothetical protein D3C83_29900 [compost metagenome]
MLGAGDARPEHARQVACRDREAADAEGEEYQQQEHGAGARHHQRNARRSHAGDAVRSNWSSCASLGAW